MWHNAGFGGGVGGGTWGPLPPHPASCFNPRHQGTEYPWLVAEVTGPRGTGPARERNAAQCVACPACSRVIPDRTDLVPESMARPSALNMWQSSLHSLQFRLQAPALLADLPLLLH